MGSVNQKEKGRDKGVLKMLMLDALTQKIILERFLL